MLMIFIYALTVNSIKLFFLFLQIIIPFHFVAPNYQILMNSILIALIICIVTPVHSFHIQQSTTASNPQMIVEGFYWKGQGEYTHEQRQFLIQLLPKGSVYLYMPQLVHTLTLWNSSELDLWKNTKALCQSRQVQLVIGIRPMSIENVNTTLKKVQAKIKQLNLPYALGWDDCPGGQTEPQKRLQVQLVKSLPTRPWGIVPGAYYSEDGTMDTWMKGLSIINDIQSSIPFILCSKNGINPSSFDPSSDFPPLVRKMIFWDNWMAVDSLTRLPRNLPRNRSFKLFNPNFNFGYILNLCFPPQRIIHGVASITYLQRNQQFNENEIANIWTSYLLTHQFIARSQATQMQGVLYELIHNYTGTMSVKQLLVQYPILSTFLYD